MRRVLLALGLSACAIPSVDFTGKACPCGEGYWCDPRTNTCTAGEPPDAALPPRDMNRSPDAATDLGTDAGPRDQGADIAVADLSSDMPPSDMPPATVIAIPFGSDWEYYDQPTAPPADWRMGAGDWLSGPAQLGYGDMDEATLLLDADPNVPSVYFRATFDLPGVPDTALLQFIYDDGVTVWINDTIVAQENVGDTTHDSFSLGQSMDNMLGSAAVTPSLFVVGENRIAAQVKQRDAMSTDVSFDLELEVTIP